MTEMFRLGRPYPRCGPCPEDHLLPDLLPAPKRRVGHQKIGHYFGYRSTGECRVVWDARLGLGVG
jgi:hypothetical protein